MGSLWSHERRQRPVRNNNTDSRVWLTLGGRVTATVKCRDLGYVLKMFCITRNTALTRYVDFVESSFIDQADITKEQQAAEQQWISFLM
jgi:hypothetical protein